MKNKMIKDLNQYLANTAVLYIKLHNLHWNCKGLNFKTVHEYLETIYDNLATVIDDTAETIKILGETPLANMKNYLEVATIEEIESKTYSTDETLKILISDLQILKNQIEEIRTVAVGEDNYIVINLLEDNLINVCKTLWILSSIAH